MWFSWMAYIIFPPSSVDFGNEKLDLGGWTSALTSLEVRSQRQAVESDP